MDLRAQGKSGGIRGTLGFQSTSQLPCKCHGSGALGGGSGPADAPGRRLGSFVDAGSTGVFHRFMSCNAVLPAHRLLSTCRQ